MRECKGCGAPLEGDPTGASLTCRFCRLENFNEAYLERRIASIDFSKVHNLLEVGLTAFKAGEYEKARATLDKVLHEDSNNQDAWVYSAVCCAHLADLSNLDQSVSAVDTYLAKASEIGAETEVYRVGATIARNTIGATLLRSMTRSFEQGQKAYFAFSSTDSANAIRQRNRELEFCLRHALPVIRTPPNDPHLAGEAAVMTLNAIRQYSGQSCPPRLDAMARGLLDSLKDTNPELHSRLTGQVARSGGSKSAASGCAPFVAIIGVVAVVVAVMANSDSRWVENRIPSGQPSAPHSKSSQQSSPAIETPATTYTSRKPVSPPEPPGTVPPARRLERLTATGPSSVFEGQRGVVSAIAVYSDGDREDVTRVASWSSDSAIDVGSNGALIARRVDSSRSVQVKVQYKQKTSSHWVTIKNLGEFTANDSRNRLGATVVDDSRGGVRVTKRKEGSPAGRCVFDNRSNPDNLMWHLDPGERITGVDGRWIADTLEFIVAVENAEREMQLSIVDTQGAKYTIYAGLNGVTSHESRFGANAETVRGGVRVNHNVSNAVPAGRLIEPKPAGSRPTTSLYKGDIITHINGNAIRNRYWYFREVQRSGKSMRLTVYCTSKRTHHFVATLNY